MFPEQATYETLRYDRFIIRREGGSEMPRRRGGGTPDWPRIIFLIRETGREEVPFKRWRVLFCRRADPSFPLTGETNPRELSFEMKFLTQCIKMSMEPRARTPGPHGARRGRVARAEFFRRDGSWFTRAVRMN